MMIGKKTVLWVTALGLVLIASATNVSARGVSASAGKATSGNDTCFRVDATYDGVTNICTSTVSFHVPLPVDTSGTKSMTFAGQNISCRGVAFDQLTGSYSASGYVSIGSTPTTASTATFTMAGAGRMWLDCNISQNGKLYNVNYGQ